MSQKADAIAARPQTGPPARKKSLSLGQILTHAFLFIALLFFIFPFYWMVTSSLKPVADIYIISRAVLACPPLF